MWDMWCEMIQAKVSNSYLLTRIFHELLSRDREDGLACPPCEPARQSPEAKPMADGQGEAGGPPGNRRVLVLRRT